MCSYREEDIDEVVFEDIDGDLSDDEEIAVEEIEEPKKKKKTKSSSSEVGWDRSWRTEKVFQKLFWFCGLFENKSCGGGQKEE